MKRNELVQAIADCELDIAERTAGLAVQIREGKITRDDANTQMNELRSKKVQFEKELAELDRPDENTEKRGWVVAAESMKERRSVTLSDTGNVFVAHDLKLAVQKNADILNGASFYYGKNASSVVPVFPQNVAASFVSEGGTVTPASQNLARKQLILGQAIASLPVSEMTLNLSATEFAGRVPEIFGNSMTALMAQEMLTGTGSYMKGIFTDSDISLNNASGETITIANLGKLAVDVRSKKYANPVIIMSPTVYGQFLADTSTDESTKIMKEDLIRNKMIEGVKVVISGYAPATYTSGAIAAVAGDLSNYAIALADEVTIKAKDTASSDIVTFDGISYFAGCPLISADFVGFKVA